MKPKPKKKELYEFREEGIVGPHVWNDHRTYESGETYFIDEDLWANADENERESIDRKTEKRGYFSYYSDNLLKFHQSGCAKVNISQEIPFLRFEDDCAKSWLPIPPSANKMYVVRNNRMVKSKVYKDWLRDNLYKIEEYYCDDKIDWAESVGVVILANLERNRDLDNIVKPMIDALVIAKIIPDDNFVDSYWVARSTTPPKGCLYLLLSKPFKNREYWEK